MLGVPRTTYTDRRRSMWPATAAKQLYCIGSGLAVVGVEHDRHTDRWAQLDCPGMNDL